MHDMEHSVDRQINAIIELAEGGAPEGVVWNGKTDPAFVAFVNQMMRSSGGEDLIGYDPAPLFALASRMWAMSARRPAGQSIVKVGTSSPGADGWRNARTFIEVVTDDRPFLVDSISAALTERGLDLDLLVHPIVEARRDTSGARVPPGAGAPVSEAMIHIEMEPLLDPSLEPILEEELREVLADVAAAVGDWESMMQRMTERIVELEPPGPKSVDEATSAEAVAFLRWLRDGKFTFLGARRFNYRRDGADATFLADHAQGLGLLKDADRRVLRRAQNEDSLTAAVQSFLDGPELILVAKANFRSTVHRRVHMDYVGVKRFGPNGETVGEDRFVGLFTYETYVDRVADIPLIRRKVAQVVERAGFHRESHNEKALRNVLETYPRDELFQADADWLHDAALGVVRLTTRPRTALFLRRDPFNRFVSALVYIPRERYNARLRVEIGEILAHAYQGRVTAYYPSFTDSPLARVHYIIGGVTAATPDPDRAALSDAVLRAARSWTDDFSDALRAGHDGRNAKRLFDAYAEAFSSGYRETYDGAEAARDVAVLERTPEPPAIALRAYRREDDVGETLRLKLYRRQGPAPLSDVLPILEALGLVVIEETGNAVDAEAPLWIHDFRMRAPLDAAALTPEDFNRFEAAFEAVWRGQTENDVFNSLVLAAGLSWDAATILRALARFNQQAGGQTSPAYMARVLRKHADAARDLFALFGARFDPSRANGSDEADAIRARLSEKLQGVESLDEDRIIRRVMNLIDSIVRTNAFQKTADCGVKTTLAFKIDSALVERLPKPRPHREIFVYAPRVEGVHLRFGPIARGGLRWSDRREDYRTEILDLAKAQRVKNSVIVPTGAKGGFYPKRLPSAGERDARYEEGRGAYQDFIGALLDVTDNLVDGDLTPPPDVVRRDGDDPYLVVAADKGTAAFSDTANAIAEARGFWLGDAFASGGSKGYDHKVMGITARGAWEAVKRHFREVGVDIQNEPFSVIGVGDMSGDVFGNGMLLSRKIRLQAAFDHRHIFVDPEPDIEASYQARQELFQKGRSSWAEYDASTISKGGGVFSRASKTVDLTPEIRGWLGVDDGRLAPTELIRRILAAQADLLWFGGIGTYVKAKAERHADVADRANDPLRIDADELAVKVVGEGANLGMTQAARIAFAERGGRVNTDAIDNAAGVDSSDHEVNIKVLLRKAVERGELDSKARDPLLADMTDDVARLVLRHNYDQTGAISVIQGTAPHDLSLHVRFLQTLESEGRLDREVEGLPSLEELERRQSVRQGLLRPEIAVLLAYAKIRLYEAILASSLPDDPLLAAEVKAYFPPQLAKFEAAMAEHPLRREIVATRVANALVDLGGLTLHDEVANATGADLSEAGKAVYAGREIFDMASLCAEIDALDHKAPAALQVKLRIELAEILRRHAVWLVSEGHLERREAESDALSGVIARYREAAAHVSNEIENLMTEAERLRFDARVQAWREMGAPEALAKRVASLRLAASAPSIVELAEDGDVDLETAAKTFFAIGGELRLDKLRSAARAAATELMDPHEEYAARRLADGLTAQQARVAAAAIRGSAAGAGDQPAAAVSWLRTQTEIVRPVCAAFDNFLTEGPLTVAKLTLSEHRLRDMSRRLA